MTRPAERRQRGVARRRQAPALEQQDPFPVYVRAGYETMDEYMDGFEWQFDYDAKTKTLTYNAIRDEYAVVQPITNKLGVLMLNFYTEKPPPKALAKKIPIEMLGDPAIGSSSRSTRQLALASGARQCWTRCNSYVASRCGGDKSGLFADELGDDRAESAVVEALRSIAVLPDVEDAEHARIVVEPGAVGDEPVDEPVTDLLGDAVVVRGARVAVDDRELLDEEATAKSASLVVEDEPTPRTASHTSARRSAAWDEQLVVRPEKRHRAPVGGDRQVRRRTEPSPQPPRTEVQRLPGHEARPGRERDRSTSRAPRSRSRCRAP